MKSLLALLLSCGTAIAQTTVTPAPVTPAAVTSPSLSISFSSDATQVIVTGGATSPLTIPVPAPTCPPPQPPNSQATVQCTAPLVGSYTQTTAYVCHGVAWIATVSPTSPPAGACTTPTTLPDAVVTTGGVNVLASTTVNWDYGNITQIGPVTYAGANAWQMNACTGTATATTQVCSQVPAGGGGGWLNPFPSPGYFNSAGYNWVSVTLAPTRAGQVWLLGQPYVPNTATTTDVPVAGAVSIQDISKYGPKPQVGVYATYKIPLHCGVVAGDCGVNAHVAGDILLKQGIQDQINSSGNNPTLGAGNVWYLADMRYTVN